MGVYLTFEQVYKPGLSEVLYSIQCESVKSVIDAKIVGHFTNNTNEGRLWNQSSCRIALVASYFAKKTA